MAVNIAICTMGVAEFSRDFKAEFNRNGFRLVSITDISDRNTLNITDAMGCASIVARKNNAKYCALVFNKLFYVFDQQGILIDENTIFGSIVLRSFLDLGIDNFECGLLFSSFLRNFLEKKINISITPSRLEGLFRDSIKMAIDISDRRAISISLPGYSEYLPSEDAILGTFIALEAYRVTDLFGELNSVLVHQTLPLILEKRPLENAKVQRAIDESRVKLGHEGTMLIKSLKLGATKYAQLGVVQIEGPTYHDVNKVIKIVRDEILLQSDLGRVRFDDSLGEMSFTLKDAFIEAKTHVIEGLIRSVAENPQALFEVHPREFEEMIAFLLEAKGWKVTLGPGSRDGGVDLLAINKTIDGFPVQWAVQCKRNSATRKVGVDIVRALHGTKEVKNMMAVPMVVTSSGFTSGATNYRSSSVNLALKGFDDVMQWIKEIVDDRGDP